MKQNMTNKMPEYRKNTRRGVALIEAMISIIVLAIGVLGVLGLQLRTMVESQQSANRALAVRLAEDFSERVKNNPDIRYLVGDFDGTGFATGGWIDSPGAASSCSSCDPDGLAAFDNYEWRKSVFATFPNARVNVFGSTAGQIGIMFAWDGNLRARDGESADYRRIYDGVDGRDFDNGDDITCSDIGNPELVCHLVYISY